MTGTAPAQPAAQPNFGHVNRAPKVVARDVLGQIVPHARRVRDRLRQVQYPRAPDLVARQRGTVAGNVTPVDVGVECTQAHAVTNVAHRAAQLDPEVAVQALLARDAHRPRGQRWRVAGAQ